MPSNTEIDRCISSERSALVFWSPEELQRKPGARVHIIDVFSLQVVTGYTRDSQGRLLLEASPLLASSRNWTMAKASQLIRNDAKPNRWVALHLDRLAWGMFWAGGGLQHCREMLNAQSGGADTTAALMPATQDALLDVVLDLHLSEGARSGRNPECPSAPRMPASTGGRLGSAACNQPTLHELLNIKLDARKRRLLIWRITLAISLGWLVVLGITVSRFHTILDRHERKTELLQDHTAPVPREDHTTHSR
jgi:hypothetical protein